MKKWAAAEKSLCNRLFLRYRLKQCKSKVKRNIEIQKSRRKHYYDSNIDYDAGNIKSVEKALQYLGQETVVTRDPQVLLMQIK